MENTLYIPATGKYNGLAINVNHSKHDKAVVAYGYPAVLSTNSPQIVLIQTSKRIADMPRLNRAKLEKIRETFFNEAMNRTGAGGEFLRGLATSHNLSLEGGGSNETSCESSVL